MTGYLVDTNIVSIAAPGREGHTVAVVQWMEQHSPTLHLSVITVAEIEAGIAKLHREKARGKASMLADWLAAVLHLYGDRVIPLDIAVARATGRLSDMARGVGHAPCFTDIAIAATAQVYGLTILTRNLRHFVPLGVATRDPFAQE